MVEPLLHRVPPDPRDRGEEPSFLMVVLLSGVVLAVFFVLAFFVLRATAVDLLPASSSPSHTQSVLRLPRSSVRAV